VTGGTITIEELARRIRLPQAAAAALLEELAEAGLVEQAADGAGWRLTHAAANVYGQALVSMIEDGDERDYRRQRLAPSARREA
jgi:DNA-binding IclR family transcriptional regulator